MYDARRHTAESVPRMATGLARKGYILREKLGSGIYGDVRAAHRISNPNTCLAVKVVNTSKAPPEFITKFFPRELKILKVLNHPNIIKVLEVLKMEHYTYIVMERAVDGDLLEHVMKNGPMSNWKARHIFGQVADALHHCQFFNIAHRDLKCENILLDGDGNAKLTDFGFARDVIDPETNKRVLSHTYCGSAAYAAPEIISGTPYNPMLSDVWSLGVILFIMVTGVMPFDDADRPKMLIYQRKGKWKIPSRLQSTIDPRCSQLISHLLEPDVTQRATLRQLLDSDWLKSHTRSTTSDVSVSST